jgi:cation transport ATPase
MALTTANVGIAIGAGTDVAIESAGIVLVRSDPRDVVGAIQLSRATYRKMIQNLIWATTYNIVAIPVAAGLFVHWGVDLLSCYAAFSCNKTLSRMTIHSRSAEFVSAPSRCRSGRPGFFVAAYFAGLVQ